MYQAPFNTFHILFHAVLPMSLQDRHTITVSMVVVWKLRLAWTWGVRSHEQLVRERPRA